MSNDSTCLGTSRKRRRISLEEEDDHANPFDSATVGGSSIDSPDLASSYLPPAAELSHMDPEANISTISTNTKFAEQTVTPFLAQHIPAQHPLPEDSEDSDDTHQVDLSQDVPSKVDNSKKNYCYRHRPGLKCRRQVDEPSMDQLQRV